MDVIDIKNVCSAIDGTRTWYRDKSHLDTTLPAANVVGRREEGTMLAKFLAGYRIGGGLPTMIAVRGRSGCGKTTVVRYVCENMPRVGYAIVNLRIANTAFGCLNAILKEMGISEVKSAKGLNGAFAALGKEIENRLSRAECNVFALVLDDFDSLRRTEVDMSDILNRLTGMVEELRKKGHLACVIAIMNEDYKNFEEVEERIISRIAASVVPFMPYSHAEITAILKDRAERALCVKVPDHVINYCATLDEGLHGDARRAIDLLRTSCEIAFQKAGCWQPDNEHVFQAIQRLDVDSTGSTINVLPTRERSIAGIIAWRTKVAGNDWHSTKQLYDHYSKDLLIVPATSFRMGYRQFSELLEYLEKHGVVESKLQSEGRGSGVQRYYRLKLAVEIVGERVYGSRWQEIESSKRKIAELQCCISAALTSDMISPVLKEGYVAMCNQKCSDLMDKLLLDE